MATRDSEQGETGARATAPSEDKSYSATYFRRAFSIPEFCRRYSIGRTNAYQEIATGHLRAVKVGRRTLITHDDAEAWLAALPVANTSHRGNRQEKHHGR